jgi:very-short-patch-repair endonuclease
MTRLQFLERARNIHGYKYNYPDLSEKLRLNDKIIVEYKGHYYKQSINKHLKGKSPEKAISKKTTQDFIKEAKKIWGDKYDYSLTEYTGALNMIKIIYKGVVYEQRASSHLAGLAPEFRKNQEVRIKELIRDSDKSGEAEIESFLIKYKIKYQKYIRFNDVEFDFYLSELRTAIQYDGIQHYEVIEDFGGYETYLKIIESDVKLEKYCEDNFINLIRIKYNQIYDSYDILWQNLKNYIK